MNEKNKHRFEIIVGVIGNALVWYNFALFMPFLPIISKEFFPIEDPFWRTNVSFLVMAVGLLVRPLGSAIFGPIGDKIGRQKAISMSILLMAIPTFLMGFIPNYKTIGIWSPILLILCRALQGISLGGEYTAAMVNFVEKAPGNRRGFYGSWSEIGSQIGVLLAAHALVSLHSFFSEAEVYEYGWRFAFFGAIALLPFAFLVHEEEKPKKEQPHSKEPIFSMLLHHKKEVISTFFITAFSALGFYTLLTFLPSYLVEKNMLSIKEASMCSVAANFALIISAFICGYLSDIFKRKGFLAIGMIGVTIVVYFMFLMDVRDYSQWLIIQILYGWFIGMYYSCRAAFFSEAFPKSVRCTGVSVSLSLAQAIFGGSASNIMNFCVSSSGFVAVIPTTIITAIALYCLTLIEDRTGKELRE